MHSRLGSIVLLALGCIVAPVIAHGAQTAEPDKNILLNIDPPGKGEAVKITGPQVSGAVYQAQLAEMQELVAACQTGPLRCDDKAVPADEWVDHASFHVRWDWLRTALSKAHDPRTAERAEMLNAAADRLTGDRSEAGDAGATPVELEHVPDARKKTDEILARSEFRRVEQTSWFREKVAALMLLIDQLFSGAAKLVPRSPLFALALEWGLLAVAAALLIAWALRQSRQQRLVIGAQRTPTPVWQAESDDWAARAAAEATRGNWREAVHCLYWSAIVTCEGQRLWRQNRARTPREYVVLLEPGSARRRALSGLTRVFERIWYGIRPATATDYERATALLNELRAG